MLIQLTRIVSGPEATLGIIRVDGEPVCWSLEDQAQPAGVKIPGETRIHAGIYRIAVRTAGGYHKRCARRWPGWHRGMLQLMNVPRFNCILIHPGNTDDDTKGCILTGSGATLEDRYSVTRSVDAYRRLYAAVIEAALAGDLSISIRNKDG